MISLLSTYESCRKHSVRLLKVATKAIVHMFVFFQKCLLDLPNILPTVANSYNFIVILAIFGVFLEVAAPEILLYENLSFHLKK